MKIASLFLAVTLALLGSAVYIGMDVRSSVMANPDARTARAGTGAANQAVAGSEPAPIAGKVPVATTATDFAEWLQSIQDEQAGSQQAAKPGPPVRTPRDLTPKQREIRDAEAIARLKSVHLEHGFAVLDSGLDQSLQKGMKLAVRREHYLVGQLIVGEAVYETECVVDVVSIPRGISLSKGDEVIHWADAGN